MLIKMAALSSLLVAPNLYAASVAACAGCHGQHFEKAALGKSKIVKDMSKEDIIAAMKGYKDGSYGGAMKGVMKGQVASLDDATIEGMAGQIVGGGGTATDKATEHAAAAAVAAATVVDINTKACDPARIKDEDLGNKETVTEEALGLRKVDLYSEDKAEPAKTDYSRPAPGSSTRFERAYVNAPPMIPHSVEGLLPITKDNNQCLGCHMPEAAKGVGATAIPTSHFTNFRPTTVMKDGNMVKEGKTVGMNGEMGNVSDIKIAKAKHLDKLYQGRFNCTQCHAPQAKVKTAVANTFTPDFEGGKGKTASSLMDVMNEGVE